MSDIDRALSALYAIPPDLPRDDWQRVGRAAIAAGLDVDALIDWSRNAPNFKNEQDVQAAFRMVTTEGGTGAGTLYKVAAENGWRMGADRPVQAARKSVEPRPKPVPSASAELVWNRCTPATAGHPYATKKSASTEAMAGLRVLPDGDPLRVMGESMAGALVVPCWDGDTLATLQFITASATAERLKAAGKPSKLNLPGASVQGRFTVGELAAGGTAYLCEGIGAAWSVWQATGAASVVCFGVGNMGKVADALRDADPSARLVLVPDTGKEKQAADIAAEHGCMVAAMPSGEADNFDANDLFLRDGFDVLAQLLEAASEPPKPEPLLQPVSVFDVASNPSTPPAFVWDGYLPRGVVSLLGAHGGTGKSTVALMLSVCAALGRSLFGVDTKPCNVVFASLEDGSAIVRHRLAGICETWAINPADLEGKLNVVDGTANPELFSADNRSAGETTATYSELCALVQATGAGLVVIDNASDSFGGDEINRRQVRAFMRSLAQVAQLTDCAALLLAHVDKGTSRNRKAEGGEGYSGSTAWHNSARSRLFMSRTESGLLTLEHQKSNLGKMREPLTLCWHESGLPMLAESGSAPQQGRTDDATASALLRILAEFESRGQFCSPAITSRNHVYAVLGSEPAFKALKLHKDDTKRIVTQCQRAGWLERMDYRTPDRKPHERWTLTADGRLFADIPVAPTAPTA